jgi:hypothetical protein
MDGVKFDIEQLFRYLVQHFRLSEKAKHTSVEFAITVDWAPLDSHCGHATLGFKIVDEDDIVERIFFMSLIICNLAIGVFQL